MQLALKNRFSKLLDKFLNRFNKVKDFLKVDKNQKYILFGYIAALLFLLIIRDVVDVNLNKFIFVALFAIVSLISTNLTYTYALVFTIPFRIGLPDLYITIIALIAISIRFYKEHSIKGWLTITIVPIVIFVLELILSATNLGIQYDVSLRLFTLLLLVSFFFYDRKLFNVKHILFYMSGTVAAYIIIALGYLTLATWAVINRNVFWVTFSNIFNSVRFGSRLDLVSWLRTTPKMNVPLRNTGICLGDNPNNIGLFCLVGLLTGFALFPTLDRKKRRIVTVLMIFFLLFGIWGQSRAFILFGLLGFIAALIFSCIQKRKPVIDVLIVACTFVLIISVLLLFNSEALTRILKRFFQTDTSTGGNRLTLIGNYLGKMFTNAKWVIFGVGCTNLQAVYNLSSPPHTNFVQIICSYGIPFFICFVTFIVFAFSKTKKRINIKNYRFSFYLPFIFAFLFTLTDQIFNPPGLLVAFIPCAMIAAFNNKNSEIEILENYYRMNYVFDKSELVVCSNVNLKVDTNFKKEYKNSKILKVDYADCSIMRNKKKRISKYAYYLRCFDEFKPNIIYIKFNKINDVSSFLIAAGLYKRARVIMVQDGTIENLTFKEKLILSFFTPEEKNVYSSYEENLIKLYGNKILKRQPDCLLGSGKNDSKPRFDISARKQLRSEIGIKNNEKLIMFSVDKTNKDLIVSIINNLNNSFKAILISKDERLFFENKKVVNQIVLNDLDEKIYSAIDFLYVTSNDDYELVNNAQKRGVNILIQKYYLSSLESSLSITAIDGETNMDLLIINNMSQNTLNHRTTISNIFNKDDNEICVYDENSSDIIKNSVSNIMYKDK